MELCSSPLTRLSLCVRLGAYSSALPQAAGGISRE